MGCARIHGPCRDTPSMEQTGVSAIVLAGGRSSRFGGDKLAVLIDGRPLLHHAIAAVSFVADEVIVAMAPDDPAADPTVPDLPVSRVPLRLVRDERLFAGPLAGLRAGGIVATHAILLVVAGDMPALVPGVLRLLVGALEGGATAAALGDLDRGAAPHPLPLALARAAAVPAIDVLLAADCRSLKALLAALGASSVDASRWQALDPDGRTLRDVDRPEDLPGR